MADLMTVDPAELREVNPAAVLGTPNPLLSEMARPEALVKWRAESMRSLERPSLEWDAIPDGEKPDLSWAPDPEAARKRGLTQSWLRVRNNGVPFVNQAEAGLMRDAIAHEENGGAGAGDDAAFFDAVVAPQMQKQRDRRQRQLDMQQPALSAELFRATGQDETGFWREWIEKARAAPDWEPGDEITARARWDEIRAEARRSIEDFGDELAPVWEGFQSGKDVGGLALQAYGEIPEEDRGQFIDSLRLMAQAMPEEERRGFWANLSTSGRRSAISIGAGLLRGAPAVSTGERPVAGEREALAERSKADKFLSEIRRIQQQEFDPVVPLAEEDSFLSDVELGIYAMPGVVAQSALMAVPGAGPALVLSTMVGQAEEDLYLSMIDKGVDRGRAATLAGGYAPILGAIQYLPERMGFKLWTRQFPAAERVLNGFSNRIKNRAARFALSGGLVTVGETGTEIVQEVMGPLTEQLIAALHEDMPGVDWNEELSALEGMTVQTMVAMLPLALMGAAGGMNQEARARAFAGASPLVLRAWGIKQEDIDRLEQAKKQGPASVSTAAAAAWGNKDTQAPEATAARQELSDRLGQADAAARNAVGLGVLPRVVASDAGFEVIDSATGETIGVTENATNAAKLALMQRDSNEQLNADEVAQLSTTFQGAQEAIKNKPGTSVFDIRLEDVQSTEQEAALSERHEAALLEEVRSQEVLAGGDGGVADIILGSSTSEFRGSTRQTLNRIFRGGSVLTVFHEDAHGLFHEAVRAGKIDRQKTIDLIRGIDASSGRRRVKGGKRKDLLPEGDVTDKQLGEAVAEVMESEVFRSRKGTGARNLPPRMVSDNLRAIAKLDGGNTFGSFLRAIKARWEAVIRRAHAITAAIQSGEIDAAEYQDFMDRLLGTDPDAQAQAAEDAEVESLAPDYALGPVNPALKTKAPNLERWKKTKGFADKPKSTTIDSAISALDKIKNTIKNPLGSITSWGRYVGLMRAGGAKRLENIPMSPSRAMDYARDVGAVARITDGLVEHPEFVAARISGLSTGKRMLKEMRAGNLGKRDLSGLFIWGLLSRGVGAFEQEGGYIALHKAGLLDMIDDYFAGKIDTDAANEWAKERVKKTPGASTAHNAMKVGDMLKALKEQIDGRMAIDHLFDAWTSEMTGPQIRREIARMFTGDRPSLQISNKVLSFAILVSGRPDVLVFDRVQFRHLFGGKNLDKALGRVRRQIGKAKRIAAGKHGKDSVRYKAAMEVDEEATNAYDSLPRFDEDGDFIYAKRTKDGVTKVSVARSGFAPLGDGLTGLAIYEAIEEGIEANVRQSYADRGIDYPGIGAFHWDSWLVESQQAIEHPTIQIVAKQNEQAWPSLGVLQGKFTRIESGVAFRYDGNYARELLDGSGDIILIDPDTYRREYKKKNVDKAIGRKITLKNNEDGTPRTRPWVGELSAEEAARFDTWLAGLGSRQSPAAGFGSDYYTDGPGSGSGDNATVTDYALAPAEIAETIGSDARERRKGSSAQMRVMGRVVRRMTKLRTALAVIDDDGQEVSLEDLEKQRDQYRAMRESEMRENTRDRFRPVFDSPDLAKLKKNPAHAALASPKSNLHGRLMSKSAAITNDKTDDELATYEGSVNVNRTVWGGELLPSEAAAELHRKGIIDKPTTDALWLKLRQEQESVDRMKRAVDDSKAEMRAIPARARADADDWFRERSGDARRMASPVARLRNAIGIYNSILTALPVELRGKLGGLMTLAKLGKDETRVTYLQGRVDKAEAIIEAWAGKEFDRRMEKLMRPGDFRGKKPKGKIGTAAEATMAKLREYMGKPQQDALDEVEKMEGKMDDEGDLLESARLRTESSLLPQVSDWENRTAAEKERGYRAVLAFRRSSYQEELERARLERELVGEQRDDLINGTGATGDPGMRMAKEQWEKTWLGRKKAWIWAGLGFDHLMNWAFPESPEMLRLVDWQRRADNTKDDGIWAKSMALDDFMSKLAGGNNVAGMKLQYKLGTNMIKVTQPNGNPMELTELQGLTATMMWMQEEGKRHMLGHLDKEGNPVGEWHYNQEFVDDIESKLSDQAKAVRTFLLAQYQLEYDSINQVFRVVQGIDLPKHGLYSPLSTSRKIQSGKNEIADPLSGATVGGSSSTPGSLMSRSGAIAEPVFRDASQVYTAHTRQMEHWKAYAEFTKQARRVLQERSTRNAVTETLGPQAAKILGGWVDWFGTGGTTDAANHMALMQSLGRMTGRAAQVALWGRASTLAVQYTQVMAGMAEVPTAEFVPRFAKLMTGQLEWGPAFRSEYIQRRVRELPIVAQLAMDSLKAAKPGQIRNQVRKLGQAIGGVDAMWTAGTYAIVYDYQLSLAKEAGLQGDDATRHARNEAERITDRVAQPTRSGARSYLELTSTNPGMRVGWAFASEARKNAGLMVYNVAKGSAGQKMRTVAFVFLVNGLMAQIVRNAWRDIRDGDDDEVFDEKHWSVESLLLATFTDPFKGFPLVGDALQAGAFKAAGEYVPEGNLFSGIGRGFQAGRSVWGMATGTRYVSARRIVNDADIIISALGIGFQPFADAASISHIANDLTKIIDAQTN